MHSVTVSAKRIGCATVATIVLTMAPGGAVTFQADVAGVNGFTAVDKISWSDSKGLAREAYFAKTYPGMATAKGYITRFVYHASSTEAVTCDEPSVADSQSGMGLSLNYQGSWSSANTSQKKAGSNFTQQVKFQGANHLIYEITFNEGTTNGTYAVTIDWCFYEGLDYVLYAITTQATGFTSNDDTRGPFCDFNWDGYGDTHTKLNGMSWGTDKFWTIPVMDTVTPTNSAYTFGNSGSNLVPFATEWLLNPSREIGLVQTQLQSRHTGGCYTSGWVQAGTHTLASTTSGFYDYPFYQDAMEGWVGNAISWGTPVGSPSPRNSYTVAVLLDAYTGHGVDSLLRETERITQHTTLSATTGAVVASGATGAGLSTNAAYYPAGYDQVYRAWRVNAAGNAATVTLAVSAGSVRNPVFVVGSVTAGVSSVSLNGSALASGTGYVTSFNQATGEAWVTILSSLSGSSIISIAANGTGVVRQLAGRCTSPAQSSALYSLQGRLLERLDRTVRNPIFQGVVVARSAAAGALTVMGR